VYLVGESDRRLTSLDAGRSIDATGMTHSAMLEGHR
jgi:hypothetical protein